MSYKSSKPLEPIHYVYIIFRPEDGSPCYVGKGSVGDRVNDHISKAMAGRHRNKNLSSIIRNANGDVPNLIVRDCLTEQEAFETEISLISAIGRKKSGGPLTNLTDGGEGVSGLRHSQETIEKCRIAHLGLVQSESTIRNRTSKLRGRTRSAETREKISRSNISSAALHDCSGENNHFYGRKHSAQSIEKMRVSLSKALSRNNGVGFHTGHKHSEETKLKMSLARVGKSHPHTEESKEKIRASWVLRKARRGNVTVNQE